MRGLRGGGGPDAVGPQSGIQHVGEGGRQPGHRFPLMHASVLGRLDREGPLSTVDLANAERVRPQSMGQTLAELEAQGLIERRPDPEDGRRTLLELTEPGREVLTEERRRRDGWMARAIEAELDEEERRTLGQAVELLERLSRV
jgi:DNA-binding MarR family transcriptional regulator